MKNNIPWVRVRGCYINANQIVEFDYWNGNLYIRDTNHSNPDEFSYRKFSDPDAVLYTSLCDQLGLEPILTAEEVPTND